MVELNKMLFSIRSGAFDPDRRPSTGAISSEGASFVPPAPEASSDESTDSVSNYDDEDDNELKYDIICKRSSARASIDHTADYYSHCHGKVHVASMA
eukprot:10557209-Karenia_brevis.AAC.1